MIVKYPCADISSSPKKSPTRVGISFSSFGSVNLTFCRQIAVSSFLNSFRHHLLKFNSKSNPSVSGTIVRLQTENLKVAPNNLLYMSRHRCRKLNALYKRLSLESHRERLLKKFTVILSSMNFLFHGYDWKYDKDLAKIKIIKNTSTNFTMEIEMLCSQAFLYNSVLAHCLLGLARDAFEFGDGRYSFTTLTKGQWTFEEIDEIFKSGDKEHIKPVVATILHSMLRFRLGRNNTPFGRNYYIYLLYLLDKDKNFSVFRNSKVKWAGGWHLHWWESSQMEKVSEEYEEDVTKFFETLSKMECPLDEICYKHIG